GTAQQGGAQWGHVGGADVGGLELGGTAEGVGAERRELRGPAEQVGAQRGHLGGTDVGRSLEKTRAALRSRGALERGEVRRTPGDVAGGAGERVEDVPEVRAATMGEVGRASGRL